jgi:DNA adenine methylase
MSTTNHPVPKKTAVDPDRRPRPKLRPPVKWHGGKYYLAGQIVDRLPEHHTYLEPFGGAASVLLNKQPSPIEVYNDLDERVTQLVRVLRTRGEEFAKLLALTPYSEVEFRDAAQTVDDELEQARRDFVRWRLSLGGRGKHFSFTLHRVRRQMADVVSGYLSMIDEQLPAIIDRLRTVQIVSRPAIEVIKTWDSPDTVIYCDPPYVHETRSPGSRDVYGVEMSAADHRELAAALHNCKSRVLLSGYASDLYDELYAGWRHEEFDIANHAAGGKAKSRKVECLWRNFA